MLLFSIFIHSRLISFRSVEKPHPHSVPMPVDFTRTVLTDGNLKTFRFFQEIANCVKDKRIYIQHMHRAMMAFLPVWFIPTGPFCVKRFELLL